MSSNVAVRVEHISKIYQLYNHTQDRLKQSILPRLQALAGFTPRQYYREFWALRDVSFEIEKGETVGIVGRNGSGKSTLLQVIAGTLTPTTGSVTVNGRLTALLELGSGFNPEFTGRENVYLAGSIMGFTRQEMDNWFDDIAAFADIGGYIDQQVKFYSSGMYVRLAFATNIMVWSRAVLGLTWVFILFSAPLSRKVFRRLGLRFGLWGVPVAVFGETDAALSIYQSLRRNPLTGLWPVLCVRADSLTSIFPKPSAAVPAWGLDTLCRGIDIAIIVPQKAPLGAVKNVLLNKAHRFRRIIVMFDEVRMGAVWFTPLHLMEHLGLEVQHQLINPAQRFVKRWLDVLLILLSLPLLLPFLALIALAIRLDSPGAVLYSQKRVGFGGKEIRIWKFRSMVANAESVLHSYLQANPALLAEWQESFKLKQDPRITRVGNFLRRTSLDELPQLWNVMKREMSLIGPRPIVTEEIPLYGEDYEIYKQVLPGLTGMWQISGRSDLTYAERVNLDVYYVQNWSVWLDFHILLHTFLIALQGRGAY